jgi:hypothetical protein
MPTSWKIAGSYFEACNCEVACPCVLQACPQAGNAGSQQDGYLDS